MVGEVVFVEIMDDSFLVEEIQSTDENFTSGIKKTKNKFTPDLY